MDLIFDLVFCFLPIVIFILLMFVTRQEISLSLCIIALLLGLAPLIPAAVLQLVIPEIKYSSLIMVLLSALIFNGIIEEGVKAGFLFLFPSSKSSLKQFFIYSLLAGLCFGCFEAVVYVVSGLRHIEIRFLTAVVIHTVCSGIGGLFVWSCRTKQCRISILLNAVIIHGIYNFFAGFTGVFWWFSLAAMLFAVIQARSLYRSLLPQDVPLS